MADEASIQGMTMACPPGWQDRSMLILSGTQAGASGVTPNLVVTRDRVPPDLPAGGPARMDALIDRQVAQMRDQLARFALVSRRVDPDGGTGEVKVDWDSAQAALTQGLTFVEAEGGVLMIATATAGRGEYATHEPAFREMLASFRAG